ncbi:T3SS effector E3 ubiquitin-protein ligase IpaH1.4, partial [Shigella flexneri]
MIKSTNIQAIGSGIMHQINNVYSLTPLSLPMELTPSCNEFYLKTWSEWEKNGTPGEQRNIAFNRLKICLQNQEAELNLSELDLKTLPDLPPQITTLEIRKNQLTHLPDLPPMLKVIHAQFNQLESLPALPETLEELNAGDNKIKELPFLPENLTHLRVHNNRLHILPLLPPELKLLVVSGNRLDSIPPFPDKLEGLALANNFIEQLPELPFSMNRAVLMNNNLTTLPESVLRLAQNAFVNVAGNPLSGHTMRTLQQITTGPDYSGPRIFFSMGNSATISAPEHSLADAVTAWFPENKQSDVSQIWHAFEHEEHANTFSAFLDRLSDTVSARNTSGFREQVAAWLEKLSTSAELRQQSFAVAADATESCEDRVALTWNNLRKTLLVHQASEGLFDNDTGALLSLGREMFRLEILEDIARDKVRTLHFVDEIEVYLA